MTSNLYIVESPLQLLNAIEAKEEFAAKKNVLIVKFSNEQKNNYQIEKLLAESCWDHIYKIPYIYSTKIQIIHFCSLARFLIWKKQKFKKIFIGEFRSDEMWMIQNNLPHEETFLLDDGNMTIEVQNNYLKELEKYNLERLINKRKKDILYKFFLLKTPERKIVDLFTMFDLKPYSGQRIVQNRFKAVASKLGNINDQSNSDNVFFVGSNIMELGIVNDDYFFECIKFIINFYKNKGKKLVYIPHRREKEEKLLTIKNQLDIEILYPSNLLELDFLYKKIRPKHIASFYSTALYSLKKIYNCQEVDAFKLDFTQVKKEYRSEIASTYQFYEQYFHLVEIGKK